MPRRPATPAAPLEEPAARAGWRVALVLVTTIALALAGCVARSAPGAQCSFASDCAEPLICDRGQCRAECRTDRDCVVARAGDRCLPSGLCDLEPRGDAGGPDAADTRPSAPDATDAADAVGAVDAGDAARPDAADADAPDVADVPDVPSDAPDGAACGTLTPCGAQCVDLAYDALNCGACGTACAAGRGCSAGRCVVLATRLIAAGRAHACAALSDDTVRCWGRNDRGQLGDGTRAPFRRTPVVVRGLPASRVTALALGNTHSCAALASGDVLCWGRNDAGQLGDATTADSERPVEVMGLPAAATHIAVGTQHSCARTSSGTVWCWGVNTMGELGVGVPARMSATPVMAGGPSLRASALSASGNRTCVLEAGTGAVRCWGAGIGSTPTVVRGLERDVRHVAVGLTHACAVDASGDALCWGVNSHGQLGDGTTTDRAAPSRVVGIADVNEVAAGWQHTCAGLASGAPYCWGHNDYGQLGDGTDIGRPTPGRVAGGHPIAQIVAGDRHTCFRVDSGETWCFGDNSLGQAGSGSAAALHPTPVRVVW